MDLDEFQELRAEKAAGMLREMTPSYIRTAAQTYRDQKLFTPSRFDIAILLEYIAELKSSCAENDFQCIEHRRATCPDCYKETSHGETV